MRSHKHPQGTSVTATILLSFLLACGGEDADDPATEPAPPSLAGEVQPVIAAPAGPIDDALASEGEALFLTRGCAGCHTVGQGQLTGPDLQGVTNRREFPWFIAMVTSPDSMLREDPIARELFQEYMTAMLPLGITHDEAAAIYEYLRRENQ